jgi:hypothetical protein
MAWKKEETPASGKRCAVLFSTSEEATVPQQACRLLGAWTGSLYWDQTLHSTRAMGPYEPMIILAQELVNPIQRGCWL